MKTKAIQTWTCVRLLLEWGRHSGVSVESASCTDLRQARACCFDCVECVEKVRSASKDCTYIYSCRGRLASVFKHPWPHSVTCSWTALTGFLDVTKRPLKYLTQQQVSGNILFFSACASSVDGSFSHHCLYLFYTFLC